MNMAPGQLPNLEGLTIAQNPDFNQSMGQSVTLANMMDQRRATLAGMQRQANIRSVFAQNPDAIGPNSQVNPDALRQVYAQDPATADAMQAANYKGLMGQGAFLRGSAAESNAGTNAQKELDKRTIQDAANRNNFLATYFDDATPDNAAQKLQMLPKLNNLGFNIPDAQIQNWAKTMGVDPSDPNSKADPDGLKNLQDSFRSSAVTHAQALKDEAQKRGLDLNELKFTEMQEPAAAAKTNLTNAQAKNIPMVTDLDTNKLNEAVRHNKAEEAITRQKLAFMAQHSDQITVNDSELKDLTDMYLTGKADAKTILGSVLSGNRNADARAKFMLNIQNSGTPADNVALDNEANKQFNSPRFLQQKTAIDTFLPNISKMEAAIQARPDQALKIINEGVSAAVQQTGDPRLTNIITLQNVLSTELATSLTGSLTQSDVRLKEAQNSLNSMSPAPGALASLKMLRLLELNRRAVLAISAGRYGEAEFVKQYGNAGQIVLNGIKAESSGTADQYVKDYKEKYGDQLFNMGSPGTAAAPRTPGAARNSGNAVAPAAPQPAQAQPGLPNMQTVQAAVNATNQKRISGGAPGGANRPPLESFWK